MKTCISNQLYVKSPTCSHQPCSKDDDADPGVKGGADDGDGDDGVYDGGGQLPQQRLHYADEGAAAALNHRLQLVRLAV